MESQYVRNKFFVVTGGAIETCKLRCVYCERDIDRFVIASKKNKWFTADPALLCSADEQHLKELIAFPNEADAAEAGFHSRRAAAAEHRPDVAARSKA